MVDKIAAVSFAGAFVWGAFQYAAKDSEVHYRLFLFLLVPLLLMIVKLTGERLLESRFLLSLLLGVVLLLQVVFRPSLTGGGFIVLALGWMAFFWALWNVSRGASRAIVLFLVFFGGFEALYGFVQYIQGPEAVYEAYRSMGSHATGTYTNHNHFAGLMNMTIPLAMGVLLAHFSTQQNQLRSEMYAKVWIILLCLAFMGLGVFLSLSRAGTAVLIFTLVFLTILLSLRTANRGKRLPTAVGWVLLSVTLGLGLWVGADALLSRLETLDQSLDQRMQVYQDTLGLIAEHGAFGVGPGMYQWRFRPYQTSALDLWWRHTHNDYLQTAAAVSDRIFELLSQPGVSDTHEEVEVS